MIQCATFIPACFYSQEKGKYELIAGQFKSSDDVINIYADLHRSYPGLLGFVDPLHHQVRLHAQ